MSADVFAANLAALERRDEAPHRLLAAALRHAGPEPSSAVQSRDGRPWASVAAEPRALPLTSTYDAAAEAARWAADLVGGSALVLWGAPGAEAWRRALEACTVVFSVEPRLEAWRSLLTWHEVADELANPRWYGLWGTPQQCTTWVEGRYHPLWDGGLQTRDWRSSTAHAEAWMPLRAGLSSALERWIGDYSTQARFGARWYRNLWCNLPRFQHGVQHQGLSLEPARGAIVTGAGPGLETALEDPAHRDLLEGRPGNGWLLLATDTSLPALWARGHRPDLVLCLDGQLPSAQHFHAPLPPGQALLADLASLPLFHRLDLRVHPFLSGHPFGTIVRRWYQGLCVLDGSSGNVSGLGLAVARGLGAPVIHLWGADFSYPVAKGYARGTYVYPLAHRRTDRLHPAETRLSSYAAVGLERSDEPPLRYTTPLLRAYRERTLGDAHKRPGRLVLPGLDGRAPLVTASLPALRTLNFGPVTGDFDALRDDWRRRLLDLPRPSRGEDVPSLLRRLPQDRREDWLALMPLGLALQRLGVERAELLDRLVAAALEPLEH